MLIKTKFQIPDFGNKLVKRKRLLDTFGHIKNYKVIMLTAPAGYGKTSLISSWVNNIKKQKITWLTIDTDDNDEELFWSYFLLSFYRNIWVPEEMKHRAKGILCNAIPFSKQHLTYFINDIIDLEIQLTMVLDDFSVIRNKKIINNIEFFIRHLPSNIHLVLSGRTPVDMSLTRYKALGEVLVLTHRELSFTQEETNSFFYNMAHINLSKEEYAQIHSTFEGWIAGMQMMALTIQTTKNSGKLMLPTVTGNQAVYTYLLEEVMCNLDEETQNFLIQTSFLERFCPELCNYLFCADNSGEIIQKLENLNLFLICLDKKQKWFRYHNVFQNFLQTLVQEDEKKIHLSICRKAAEWHEVKNDWKEAISYAIKGQDFDKTISLIEGISREIGCKGEARLLHKWNEYLPKDLVENNLRLLLNSAWFYSSEGNTLKLFSCMKEIKKFATIPAPLQAEITALYSCNLAGPQAESEDLLAECKHALEFLRPHEFLMQLLCFNIGSILLLKGFIQECFSYFEQCHTHSTNAGNYYLAVISKKALISSLIHNGQLEKAEQDILQFLKVLADMGEETLPVSGLLYAQLAEIYYQRNELTEALTIAIKGNTYGELGEDTWTAGENCLILEKIYRAMNNKKQYATIKTKILLYLEDRKFFDLGIKLECFHIKTLIAEGKFVLASRRISNLEKMIKPELILVYPEFVFLKSRFYEAKGNIKKAEEALLLLKKTAITSGHKGVLCELQVLLSAIYEKRGDCFRALNELEDAVVLAEEQGNIQFFLNEGDIMEGMLKKLLKKSTPKKVNTIFVESVLCCFEIQPMVCEVSEALLSSREIEILNMLARGDGNEEIASKLFVSKNTVKTHLLNIYTKLGVHSRAKAVSKAEELDILALHYLDGDS